MEITINQIQHSIQASTILHLYYYLSSPWLSLVVEKVHFHIWHLQHLPPCRKSLLVSNVQGYTNLCPFFPPHKIPIELETPQYMAHHLHVGQYESNQKS